MQENDGAMVRFRLVFDDRHLLDKSQRSQGLRRCWFRLKPDMKNIGELASQIRECFGIRHRIVLFVCEDIVEVNCESFSIAFLCEDAMFKDEKLVKNLRRGDQCDEINHENGFEPSNTSDLRKKKQARRPMSPHSSDGEEYVVGSVVQAGCISFQPHVLLDGENSIKEQDRNNENDNNQCFKVDGAAISDGILPLPKLEVISSPVDIKKPCKHIIHFAILPPLRRLPVKGDILAYRYVEPSSSVYPQLSSPQVGEVSSFDHKTLQILLLPVLDYVLMSEENSHGIGVQPNASRYKEDGSLEIEYLSLVDVRMVKAHGPEEEEKPCQDDQARKDKWEEALVKGSGNEPNAPTAEHGNNWAQWIPNKSVNAMPGPFKQYNPPFPGRGRGRANRGPYRGMNNRIPNMNNRAPIRNIAAWNPNMGNAGFTAIEDAETLNWSYRPSGLPFPWEHH
ncbi:hypothetical protein MA16_Dca011166 [Dendrobium catenatum]|uniref:Coilin tudor domain-containing protein n=1 Tax=Dendrobium catenatum TaxID=906689 RepID=A0A2I0WSF3_9ASPA|nr:hypothetical protein MA16_Dca011166 [Dendrobium catenatum]